MKDKDKDNDNERKSCRSGRVEGRNKRQKLKMVKAEGEGRNLLGSKNVNVPVIDALQQNEGRRKR